ncbi:MAG: Preprotein translocase, SecE subunit [Candidatus Woesebacteria bacterium GW2011_GWB1_38_5b]|uniref:Protein translocase subunit SecE n=1 Tax=Candidatus Woesebacteria bacterium GW2011_GWB1_38_5b TaxID=1618569 RepID=A0A0G0K3Y5_9BACT|nr:MAG: Preprotein translocase, SecE subunit [Candidatus Woesebacteria bacterium GW2011_GWB1_38_5b]
MNLPLRYFREVRSEMTKVTWPKRDEVVRLTAVVILLSLIVGIYVGALDFSFTKLLEIFVSR